MSGDDLGQAGLRPFERLREGLQGRGQGLEPANEGLVGVAGG